MPEYSVVGRRVNRVDALSKVTGKAVFAADVVLPDMLYGKVLRSPHAHAIIRRLDTSRASALNGVKAVVTAADVPGQNKDNDRLQPMVTCLAGNKAVFAGQPVAAVAAETINIAEEAIELIEVDYEPLPSVTDPVEAMKAEAPLIFANMFTENSAEGATRPSNAFWYMKNSRGDIEEGFKQADIVLENTYRTETVHQGFLEPRASVADIDLQGKITVWTDNQGIFTVRELIAEYLNMPLNKIKVMPVEVGGAFGGKEHQQLSPLCALLAVKTNRPVKIVMSREEVFKATRPGSATSITVKLGATKEGRLTAASATMIYDFGTSTGMPGMSRDIFGFNTGLSPYRIPNVKVETYDVVTNKPPIGPYRAPTAAQSAYAVESQVDTIAAALHIDPIEFRLINAVTEGDSQLNGTVYGKIGFKEVLTSMKKYLEKQSNPEGKNRGRGIAAGLWPTGHMGSAAHIHLNNDGTIILVAGSTDISGTRTTLGQMVAEEFGVPFEKVTVVSGDTETAPYAVSSVGSMTTRSMGTAVHRACIDAKEQLCRRAAMRFGVDTDEVEFVQGQARVKSKPENSQSLRDLVAMDFRFADSGPVTGRGAGGMADGSPVFTVQAADIEVDDDTGKVKILAYAAVQDTGQAVNPTLVEGQMQGGIAQGIGWALNEGYIFKNGIMQNSSFLDYRMPTAPDLPFINTRLVEVPFDSSPFGIRGAGEPPIVAALATMANAIHSATGVRLTHLPMTPESILNGIKQSGDRSQ